nr:unnamed protein product [Digitaria exilis]
MVGRQNLPLGVARSTLIGRYQRAGPHRLEETRGYDQSKESKQLRGQQEPRRRSRTQSGLAFRRSPHKDMEKPRSKRVRKTEEQFKEGTHTFPPGFQQSQAEKTQDDSENERTTRHDDDAPEKEDARGKNSNKNNAEITTSQDPSPALLVTPDDRWEKSEVSPEQRLNTLLASRRGQYVGAAAMMGSDECVARLGSLSSSPAVSTRGAAANPNGKGRGAHGPRECLAGSMEEKAGGTKVTMAQALVSVFPRSSYPPHGDECHDIDLNPVDRWVQVDKNNFSEQVDEDQARRRGQAGHLFKPRIASMPLF